jgi:hypothetical protein
MDIKQYGTWNGSHKVGMDWQQLVFKNLKETFQKINLHESISRNDSFSTFELTADSYTENQNYSAVVIWTSRKKTNVSPLELECRDKLDTSKWMCQNATIINLKNLCDGYSDTERDCNDDSDESYLVCSVGISYLTIGIFLSYILLGIGSFAISKSLIRKCCRCLVTRFRTFDVEMPTKHEEELPSIATSLVGICWRSNEGIPCDEMDDTLKIEAKKIYRPCISDSGKKSLFMKMFTLSLHLPFRAIMLKLTAQIIEIEKAIHKQNPAEYIPCLLFDQGEDSYLSNFIKDAIEQDSFPSRIMRGLTNCMSIKSGIWRLRLSILTHWFKALMMVTLFYQDMIKDLLVLKFLSYIDEKVLTDDTDPSDEFQSVGGLNFKVLVIYVGGIFLFSQVMIFGYIIKNRNIIPEAFRLSHSANSYKSLVIVFPIVFIALERFLVNVRVEKIRYQLGELFKDQNNAKQDERDIAKTVNELSEELDSLMAQLYHLNTLKAEINLIELVFEQEPQAVLQGSIFALTLYYKRLELLSNTVFHIDFKIVFILTWCVQVLSMILNLKRALHRKRYPVTPGIAGMIMQTISIAGLLVPKLILVSLALVNMVYIYPLMALAHASVTLSLHHILGNKIGFIDLIMSLVAPTYHQLDIDVSQENVHKKCRSFGNGIAALLLQLITLAAYFFTNWILRQTVFFYTIKIPNGNGEKHHPFLENITAISPLLPNDWLYMILMYIGGIAVHYLANIAYYQLFHPWSMARGNAK